MSRTRRSTRASSGAIGRLAYNYVGDSQGVGRWPLGTHNQGYHSILDDAATYYTSQELMDFCGGSGVGLTIVPAEAHWLMGSEEQAIGVAKRAVSKMRKEFESYDVATLFQLAAHAANAHVGGSGYSAYQWVHGQDYFQGHSLPAGMDPRLAFGGLLKARDRIRIAYETEKARDKSSKLANATTRPAARCTIGQLVMLWRQRVKSGKVRGSWLCWLRAPPSGWRQVRHW